MEPEESRNDWKRIHISAKEFLAACVFLFSLSGLYYKTEYRYENDQLKQSNDQKNVEIRLQILEKQIDLFDKRVESLEKSDLIRTTREEKRETLSSEGYQPLKRR